MKPWFGRQNPTLEQGFVKRHCRSEFSVSKTCTVSTKPAWLGLRPLTRPSTPPSLHWPLLMSLSILRLTSPSASWLTPPNQVRAVLQHFCLSSWAPLSFSKKLTPVQPSPASHLATVRDIGAEYFKGYGSPFLLRRCQGSEHPKISLKSPFSCHNFGQAM